MPRQMNIKEIADRNPNLDLTTLEEWRKFRSNLSEYAGRKRHKDTSTRTSKRAQFFDDEKNDPRLVNLQRK